MITGEIRNARAAVSPGARDSAGAAARHAHGNGEAAPGHDNAAGAPAGDNGDDNAAAAESTNGTQAAGTIHMREPPLKR